MKAEPGAFTKCISGFAQRRCFHPAGIQQALEQISQRDERAGRQRFSAQLLGIGGRFGVENPAGLILQQPVRRQRGRIAKSGPGALINILIKREGRRFEKAAHVVRRLGKIGDMQALMPGIGAEHVALPQGGGS